MNFSQIKFRVLSVYILISFLLFSCKNEELNEVTAGRRDTTMLLLKGSESELKLIGFLTDEYKKLHKEINIEISGGGSSIGIDALVRNEIDIANSSRMMTRGEIKQARSIHLNPLQVIIALDAVSIITHPKVGIDSLSVNQLAGLFSGEIKNWKEIGGEDLPVVLVGRNENSGTHHYMLTRLGIDAYYTGIHIEAGNAEIVNAVRTLPGAIGYVNLGSIFEDDGVPCKTIWVAGIYIEGSNASSPYNFESVRKGDYPLTRPLYQYVNDPVSEKTAGLIRFELSDSVQSRLEAHGYFPITPINKALNLKNGFAAQK
ncbi:MAG: phosphate ABC transporter substrate-binding protein [Bacteroidia bacterium]